MKEYFDLVVAERECHGSVPVSDEIISGMTTSSFHVRWTGSLLRHIVNIRIANRRQWIRSFLSNAGHARTGNQIVTMAAGNTACPFYSSEEREFKSCRAFSEFSTSREELRHKRARLCFFSSPNFGFQMALQSSKNDLILRP